MNLFQVHLKLEEKYKDHEPFMYQTNTQDDFITASNDNEQSSPRLINVGSMA